MPHRKRFCQIQWLLLILLTALLCLCTAACQAENPTDDLISSSTSSSGEPTDPAPGPTDPPSDPTDPTVPEPTLPYIVSSAKIGATGDILVHPRVYNSCLQPDGTYDFNGIFESVAPYYQGYDYMIANLEVTFAGLEQYPYMGYPGFNCPDAMAAALKNAGVDMMLTANNHSYDTRFDGMMRTLDILDEAGLEHIGTRSSEEAPAYLVKEINGIKIGMVCYTYETTQDFSDGKKSLNGISLSVEASKLIRSFRYWDLDSFYAEVSEDLSGMRQDGAEVTMVFIHWGNEYKIKQNAQQEQIAQGLCELGVDVIVGGHPHVIEPFVTLTSQTGHQTYCLYSIGNAISNQRRYLMNFNTGHTEDGMIFEVEFERWSDGSVRLGNVGVIPTWVDNYWQNDNIYFKIIPLDPTIKAWSSYTESVGELYSSYQRSMDILGDGINQCREALGLYTLPLTLD